MYRTFCQRIQSAAAYYYGIKKIVTVISLHLRVLLAKCTPYQHLDCNISHYRYLPDALRSTKQLGLSILPKDTNTLTLAGLGTHGLVILSPALFHKTMHTRSQYGGIYGNFSNGQKSMCHRPSNYNLSNLWGFCKSLAPEIVRWLLNSAFAVRLAPSALVFRLAPADSPTVGTRSLSWVYHAESSL